MSTRSKARLAAASTSKDVPPPTVKKEQKPKTRSRKSTQSAQSETDHPEKENVKSKTAKAPSKTPSAKRRSLRSAAPVYCICQKGDDGSPMVQCGECRIWYHFSCVELKEEDAEDINVYICPSCTTTSGRRTAMHWEGPDAVEEISDAESTKPTATKLPAAKRIKRDNPPEELPSESEAEPSSEDEYVAEDLIAKGKRATRHLAFTSESESEVSDSGRRSRKNPSKKTSGSPAPSHGALKRKSHHTSHSPPAKKKKSDVPSSTDDPARKYCLGKLEELFRDIFLRYPHVRVEPQSDDDHNKAPEKSIVQKSLDELTEDEKTALVDESKQFADELEKCVFEIYSERDKHGHPSAGSNYKDRFRMLQFNLSKVDRVVIHQRISSGLITPKEISLMSSTDLADEETKQSIKIAEKEALEHSILTPTTAPRAKITHKGFEDIEDIRGEVTSLLDEERSHKEEEERRERERMARLKAQTRQRTASVSVPPESPIVAQQSHTWGGPPPIPAHALLPSDVSTSGYVSEANHSFGHTSADSMEPEINLADFINMDDETPAETSSKLPSNQPDAMESSASPTTQSSDLTPISPTGISPFAPKQDQFSLDTLWNASKAGETTVSVSPLPPPPPPPPPQEPAPAPPNQASTDDKDVPMELETGGADDEDFDMFLEEKESDSAATSPEAQQAALDALPHVWSGKINMPLDSTIPQETPVIARQIGGRHLEHGSALWKTLFPSDLLRIDGRVPVENSCKFLLQMRMNVTKELIAVAFSPASESGDVGFRILSDFLIAKGRHGLVFPWGNRPKDHHPGRELYIIPLLSSDPMPEFMELLDDLHLPKIRKANLLIGVWVLNKGKLAPPPAPPAPALPNIPQLSNIPSLPNVNSPVPFPPAPSAPPPPPPPGLPANIAAEVASLTPEQIQLMIRTLTGNGAIPLPVIPPPQPPQVSQPPQVPIPPPPPPVQPQPWTNHTPGYGIYPPPNPPMHHGPPPPPHHASPIHPPPPHSPYDRQDSWDSRSRPVLDRDDRGGRGWRGRGRGRGRGNASPPRPVDSGWPRRPRTDSGPPGQSPSRRW
ncbi:Transcription factor bye1 [Hypsizygus marmoreus]|uniref:Transcription factor BYE1 n=1 Tax=Hypsizygus marmoreus TaxID=39966 RepID=A0A369JFI5_HYPMA|nr:Transcription factor bye1 [Hypsizygus marmoreus]